MLLSRPQNARGCGDCLGACGCQPVNALLHLLEPTVMIVTHHPRGVVNPGGGPDRRALAGAVCCQIGGAAQRILERRGYAVAEVQMVKRVG